MSALFLGHLRGDTERRDGDYGEGNVSVPIVPSLSHVVIQLNRSRSCGNQHRLRFRLRSWRGFVIK